MSEGGLCDSAAAGRRLRHLPRALSGQLEAAFGAEKYQRLLALKKKYDPENFFRLNQNIDPGQRS